MSKRGVLLAISSLPGRHGIGDFGDEAYKFIDWLKSQKYLYWQILPLNPLGPGNSPYMSTCSEAIDLRYISLDKLTKSKRLKTIQKHKNNSFRVDYAEILEYKQSKLMEIFSSNFEAEISKIQSFELNHEWVRNFAVFTALQKKHSGACWNAWPHDDLTFDSRGCFPSGLEKECLFHEWCQMIAYEQWDNILKYAHENSIKIIADCPFYVDLNSVDCWSYKDEFLLDQNYQPTHVSGCPPDAFSDDGQLWGTPIYNFEKMKENGYQFLVNRIHNLTKICDVLRLDHFRAFDTYYVIPAGDTNARRGEWKNGPKTDFFDKIYQLFPKISLIAEDLGELFPSVHKLRDHYLLPGMYVTEFMVFDPNYTSNKNQIVYPGTHDNQTIRGWLKSLSSKDKAYLRKRLNAKGNLQDAFVRYTWNLPSKITIFPLQDLLNLDDSARMNTPGTMGSPNWEWKLKNMSWMNKVVYPKK